MDQPTASSLPAAEGQEASDRSLLQRLKQGSQDAATQLYLRYVHRLRALAQAQCSEALARQVESEDVVQSVFGSFFRGAAQGCYDVPVGEELWRLFLVIALNKIRARGNYHLAAKRDARRTVHSEGLEELAAEADLGFLRLTVEEALEKLSPQHREMVTLRIEGHEVAEIARLTSRSHRTVERLLQQARQRLTELMEGV